MKSMEKWFEKAKDELIDIDIKRSFLFLNFFYLQRMYERSSRYYCAIGQGSQSCSKTSRPCLYECRSLATAVAG